MASCLYRLRGGEVVKVSRKDSAFDGHNAAYFGVLMNVKSPDGLDIRPEGPNGELGELKQPGFAKRAVKSSNTMRNARPAEIATFIKEEEADLESQQAEAAESILTRNPVFAKALEALLEEADAVGASTVQGAAGRVKGKRPNLGR